MPSAVHERAGALVLVGGHESAGGAALRPLEGRLGLDGVPTTITRAGRPLERTLEQALGERRRDRPVVVLPMTLGRDPQLVGDTARTVRWVAARQADGAVALAPAFGTADHLVSWLRAACLRLGDRSAAALISAAASNPFDDADLHRIAALVRVHASGRLVEVGLRGRDGRGLLTGIDRCRRLGAATVVVLPADFGKPAGAAAPLLSIAAIAVVLTARVATATHRLAQHGDDGVTVARDADHHHGFAHAHDHDHLPAHDHSAVH